MGIKNSSEQYDSTSPQRSKLADPEFIAFCMAAAQRCPNFRIQGKYDDFRERFLPLEEWDAMRLCQYIRQAPEPFDVHVALRHLQERIRAGELWLYALN